MVDTDEDDLPRGGEDVSDAENTSDSSVNGCDSSSLWCEWWLSAIAALHTIEFGCKYQAVHYVP